MTEKADHDYWEQVAIMYREWANEQPPGPRRDGYLRKADNLERSVSRTGK